MWKVSLHYLRNRQNYADLSHGNLTVETLSNFVSTTQDCANAVSAITFLSRDKCLECLPSPFTYSCQTTCKTRDSFINWTCGKLFHIFSNAIFNSGTVLVTYQVRPHLIHELLSCHGLRIRFQNSFVRRSPDMISIPFRFVELLLGIG